LSAFVEDKIKYILHYYDIDLDDENFKDTPKRSAKVFDEFLKGYTEEDIITIMEKIELKRHLLLTTKMFSRKPFKLFTVRKANKEGSFLRLGNKM